LSVNLDADPTFDYPKDFPQVIFVQQYLFLLFISVFVQKFKKQIENTDFKMLDGKLAAALDAKVIPDLNQKY
jgi:hypothetical protein